MKFRLICLLFGTANAVANNQPLLAGAKQSARRKDPFDQLSDSEYDKLPRGGADRGLTYLSEEENDEACREICHSWVTFAMTAFCWLGGGLLFVDRGLALPTHLGDGWAGRSLNQWLNSTDRLRSCPESSLFDAVPGILPPIGEADTRDFKEIFCELQFHKRSGVLCRC